MKKSHTHPLATSGGRPTAIGVYLRALSKNALIDLVCDSLELQEITDLDGAREFIEPRLVARGDSTSRPLAAVRQTQENRAWVAADPSRQPGGCREGIDVEAGEIGLRGAPE